MNNLVLILPQTEKGIFTSRVKYELSEGFIKLWMKDSPRALKKAMEIIGENKAVISRDAINMKIFKDCTQKYQNSSNEELFLLTQKCVHSIVKKNNIKLPFYEIFICAIPDIAVEIIQKLRNYARIFTVIYSGEFDNSIFDGLYFKYGIITRHLSKMKNSKREDSLLITTDSKDYIPPNISYPVICLCDKTNIDNAIMVKKVKIKIRGNSFVDNCGLIPSVFLCNLLNIEIDDNIEVDIWGKADEIFMLDRTHF